MNCSLAGNGSLVVDVLVSDQDGSDATNGIR
jgi:hypothetical protein